MLIINCLSHVVSYNRRNKMQTASVLNAWILLHLLATKVIAKSDSKSQLIPFKTCTDSPNTWCKLAIDSDPETCYLSISAFPNVVSSPKDIWWEGDLEKPTSVEKVEFSVLFNMDKAWKYVVSLDNDYECELLGSSDYKYKFWCDGQVTRKVKISLSVWKSYMLLCDVTVKGSRHITCKHPHFYKPDLVSEKCYSKPSNTSMDYYDAIKLCGDQGGRLPMPKTEEEISYFESRVPDVTDVRSHFFLGYWLGGYRTGNRKKDFKWLDEDNTIEKTNWYRGEPDGTPANVIQTLANEQFKDAKGKWNNVYMNEKNFVICQEV